MKAKTERKKRRQLPRTYTGLVKLLPPRPIHDDGELENALEMIRDLAGFDLNEDQEDYLEALSVFVEKYEDEHHAIDDSHITGLDALKYILNERGMSGSDLGRLLGCRTLGPAILRGDRQLSKAHILKLAEEFHVDPGLFL